MRASAKPHKQAAPVHMDREAAMAVEGSSSTVQSSSGSVGLFSARLLDLALAAEKDIACDACHLPTPSAFPTSCLPRYTLTTKL